MKVLMDSNFQSLLEHSPDMILTVDRDGRITYFNHGPMPGAEDLMGTTGFGYLKAEYREPCRELLRQACATGEARHVEVLDVFDIWWSCRVVPLGEAGQGAAAMIICSDVTERKRAEAALRGEQALLRKLLEIHEGDRRRLAHEIRDGLAQEMTGALLRLQGFREQVGRRADEAWRSFDEGLRILSAGIGRARQLAASVRPTALDELGIVTTLEDLIAHCQARGGQQIEFVCRGHLPRLAGPLEHALFRIVEESLHNAWRHSQSSRILVEISSEAGQVRATVQDWGVGFDPATVTERFFGLQGVRERARLLGGSADIRSTPGQGTRVVVGLPLVPHVELAPSPPEAS